MIVPLHLWVIFYLGMYLGSRHNIFYVDITVNFDIVWARIKSHLRKL
jgi:hypothetical protein